MVDKKESKVEAEMYQEVFLVPSEVFHGIGQYLTQMPFGQVEPLINGMRSCKATQVPVKAEKKDD